MTNLSPKSKQKNLEQTNKMIKMYTENEVNQNGLSLRMIIGDNNATVCFSYPNGSCSHQHLLF